MKKQEPKIKTSIALSIEANNKAQNISHAMGISVSHLIEGLIMGAQIVPGNKEENEN